jgi:hypothetical protein
MGTPDYLAPEQAIDFHHVDIRADIYSLGCTLFFLLTGQPPFPGGSLAQKILRHQQAAAPRLESMCPGLPALLSAIVCRMLAKLPQDRYQSPAELVAALDKVPASTARCAGTVPDWTAETPPRAEVRSAPVRAAVADLDATVRQFVPPPPSTSSRSRRGLLVASAAVALVGLVVAGFALSGRGTPRGEQTMTATASNPAPARLDQLQGKVFLGEGAAPRPARVGAELHVGESLVTDADSQARLNRDERVLLELGPDTRVTELPNEPSGANGPAWRMKLEPAGKKKDSSATLTGEVRQSAGDAPLILVSAHGEVKITQGRFRLAATRGTSWLRMDQGTAQLRQTGNAPPVDVPTGSYVRFEPGAGPVVKPLAGAAQVLDDFEAATNNWFPWVGNNNNSPRFKRNWVKPGKVGKQALRVDYDLGPMPEWAGMTFAFPKRDWSRFRCLHFWFHGGQSNLTFRFTVYSEKRSMGWSWKDDFSGWREFCTPFTAFEGHDGMDVTQPEHLRHIDKVILMTNSVGKGSFQLDHLQLLEHEILR